MLNIRRSDNRDYPVLAVSVTACNRKCTPVLVRADMLERTRASTDLQGCRACSRRREVEKGREMDGSVFIWLTHL